MRLTRDTISSTQSGRSAAFGPWFDRLRWLLQAGPIQTQSSCR